MKTLNEDKAYSIGEIQGLKIETQGFSPSFNDSNPNCIFLAILPIYTLFYLFHLLHTDVYMAHKAILPRKKNGTGKGSIFKFHSGISVHPFPLPKPNR
jgi:hypothetical protein